MQINLNPQLVDKIQALHQPQIQGALTALWEALTLQTIRDLGEAQSERELLQAQGRLHLVDALKQLDECVVHYVKAQRKKDYTPNGNNEPIT
jgi:hypothetical protein